MKKSIYKTTYRFVSWLSDATGGLKPLVRWKMALGIVVLGFSAQVMAGCESTCYDAPTTTCYVPIPTEEEMRQYEEERRRWEEEERRRQEAEEAAKQQEEQQDAE